MATWAGQKPYEMRLAGLTALEREVAGLGIPAKIHHNMPQTASSFANDYWQPVLFCGDDDRGFLSVKYLHSGNDFYYAVDSWINNSGTDPCQVAGELLLWWTEQSGTRM